ncbi:MAG: PTS sugar transporter subunit IIA [Gemmatimonadetes bacterium]|nr:MAG: PTS sugar transporter subunit IIA [Gemmatimonadota bacterium]
MKLSRALTEAKILYPMKSTEKQAAIQELVDFATTCYGEIITDPAGLTEDILVRERVKSTGIGNGIAITHAETTTVSKVVIVFGLSKSGIAFDSMDGKPVHFLFLIAAPPTKRVKYLSLLAGISRLFHHQDLRVAMKNAQSAAEAYQIIQKSEEG